MINWKSAVRELIIFQKGGRGWKRVEVEGGRGWKLRVEEGGRQRCKKREDYAGKPNLFSLCLDEDYPAYPFYKTSY